MRANDVFMWLFQASVGAAALILALLVARRFLRKPLGSRLVYAFWLLVALRLLIPLSLPNPLMPVSPSTADTPIEQAASALRHTSWELSDQISSLALEQPYERVSRLNIAVVAAMQPNARGWFWVAVWGLGALVTAGVMLYNDLRFRRLLHKHALMELDGAARRQYDAYADRLGLRAPKALLVDPLESACLVGGVRPYIALPLSCAGNEERYVLLHELCHVKNGDACWCMLRNLCCSLFWFHPLVWVAARLSRSDCELACDALVSRCLDGRERLEYAALLVRLAACRQTPKIGVSATGMSMAGARMKRRVTQILQSRKLKLWVLVAAAMVSLSLLTAAFATAALRPSAEALPETGGADVVQDAWLRRDAPVYFPDGDFASAALKNTADSFFSGALPVEWAREPDFLHACANLAANDERPFGADYSREDRPCYWFSPYEEDAASAMLRRYASYEAVYDPSGALVYIARAPRVGALELRLWKRSSGATLPEREYDIRLKEEKDAFEAWALQNSGDFSASIETAKRHAGLMGWTEAEVIAAAYVPVTGFDYDWENLFAFQHVTLRSADGTCATFSVEMGVQRVLAISFTDDFLDGLNAFTRRMGAEETPSALPPLSASRDFLLEKARAALAAGFGYAPSIHATVECAPSPFAYEDVNWWEVTWTEPDEHMRYRVELNDDGTLRRVMRLVCDWDFSGEPNSADFPYLYSNPGCLGLSERTVFWASGLSVEGEELPPELMEARSCVEAYIARHGLPFAECTGYRLVFLTDREALREADIGFAFYYRSDRGDAGFALVYSTLQRDVALVDYCAGDRFS